MNDDEYKVQVARSHTYENLMQQRQTIVNDLSCLKRGSYKMNVTVGSIVCTTLHNNEKIKALAIQELETQLAAINKQMEEV